MKISVIVPVYNTEAYLAECLDSLIHQTWTDLEIICVNDGSPDNSAAILAKYAEKDSRIRVITQKNGGLSSARNSGLRAATGEYVCFVDSDDRMEKIACERLAMEILGKQPDMIVFGANTIPEGALEQDPWLKFVLTPRDIMFRDGNLNELLLEPGVRPFVWRNCIRRSLLEAQQLAFDESVRYGEDTVFQLCLLPACRRVSFISDRLYDYRKDRPGSLMERLKLDALAEKVVYTGPIDAYFGYRLGALEYRSVRFETELLDTPNFQGNAAVNYTDAETPYTRIIEHKWFTFGKDEQGNDLPKTVISREYSSEWHPGDEPYYPVNDEKNSALYEKYTALADQEQKVIFGGRLGEYKYYDMDAVIAAALAAAEKYL